MKSALEEVRGLYEAIYLDLLALHPTIQANLERDFTRLRKAEEGCGLPFYTIALPAISKWLESSLSAGVLKEPRPHHCGSVSDSNRLPKILRSLFGLIFEEDGTLRLEVDISAIVSLRQVFLAVKKLNMECKEEYVEKSINDFRGIEESLPTSWPNTWDHNDPVWQPRTGHPIWGDCGEDCGSSHLCELPSAMLQLDFDPDWEGFRRFSARFSSQLGFFDPYGAKPKHGPGAVSDRVDSYVKYDLHYWTHRLESVFPYDWHGAPNSEHLDNVVYREFPSRLISVPKTMSGPRLIAAEPTAHQWIQGGIRRWLEERIPHTILRASIDFRSQETSRSLALLGSTTGLLATVDLSSASDRLSTRLVEFVFQSNKTLLDALHACRTRVVELPNKEMILLRKFSTQGSATIFPVQTIVYSLIAQWALFLSQDEKSTYALHDSLAHQVRVFGDDIVIPSHAYPVLVSLLETLGLKVNRQKSHATGLFRESCGMDAYAGVDVTPAYFRQFYGPSSTSLDSVVMCSNNFHLKGMWNTADFILKTVPMSERKRLPIVANDSGFLGIYSFCGENLTHLRKKFCEHLHRDEYLMLTVVSKPRLKQGQGSGSLTQFFHEEPDPLLNYRSGEVSAANTRKSVRWVAP